MQSEDGELDYSTLSLEGIEHAVEYIDPLTHPKNFANARTTLAARQSGRSVEPPAIDPKQDAAGALWIERILGGLIVIYAAVALINDDLVLVGGIRINRRLLHLHGHAAWCASAGLILVAGVLIVGGFEGNAGAI